MVQVTENAVAQVTKEDETSSAALVNRELDSSTDKEQSQKENGALALWKAPVMG